MTATSLPQVPSEKQTKNIIELSQLVQAASDRYGKKPTPDHAQPKDVPLQSIVGQDAAESVSKPPVFVRDPEPFQSVQDPVLPCPVDTLPPCVVEWITALSKQMQIYPDFFAGTLLVALGSLIGRKRALEMRPGSAWVEHANLWGMVIGRPSVMKSDHE